MPEFLYNSSGLYELNKDSQGYQRVANPPRYCETLEHAIRWYQEQQTGENENVRIY